METLTKLARILTRNAEWFIVLFFVLANLSWIARDTRPWPVLDSYKAAVNVMASLGQDPAVKVNSVRSFLETISQGGRPPLYQLCTVPFVKVFGYSEDAFLGVNLALLVLLFVGIYRAGVELHGRMAGLVGATAVVCFAPIVGLLHQYRAYFGGIAGVAVTLWALVALINKKTAGAAWLASASATAAVLMHPIAAYVLLIPVASTWVWMFLARIEAADRSLPASFLRPLRRSFQSSLALRGLVPAAGLPLAFVFGWYLTIGHQNLTYFGYLKSNWITSFRGSSRIAFGFGPTPVDWRWLARTSPHAISLALALLTMAFAGWLLAKGGRTGQLLVVWLIAAYFGVGVVLRVLNWQYGAFALPFVGCVLGFGAASLPGRKVRLVAGGAVIFFSLLNLSVLFLGKPALSGQLARAYGLWYDHSQLALCRNPPMAQHYPIADVLAVIAREEQSNRSGKITLFIVPSERPTAYRFVMLRFWPRIGIEAVGHGSQIWGTPFPMESFFRSKWLIVRTGLRRWYWSDRQPNLYLRAMTRFFRHPPEAFFRAYSEVKRLPWPEGGDLVLYRRSRPPSVEEIDSVVDALGLEPRFTTTAALVTAAVLETEGRVDEALERLQRAEGVKLQPPKARSRLLARSSVLLLRAGRYAEARKKAEAALQLVPDNDEAQRVLRKLGRSVPK